MRIPLPALRAPVRTIGPQTFDFDHEIVVVAIVNRTPDSFYDKGTTYVLDEAKRACEAAIASGARWLDLGGVAFAKRTSVGADEEAERILPLVEWLHDNSEVVISVDTSRAAVARAVLAAGAHVVNDTSGLDDEEMVGVLVDSEASVVVCHSLTPAQAAGGPPVYRDVVQEVATFLRQRVERALTGGLDPSRVLIDPGHDLTKNTNHSLELTRRLGAVTGLGYPTLVALSNKDFIGETLGLPVDQRLVGSLTTATVCMLLGARLLRVHNVAETVQAVRMVEAILGWRAPVHSVHNR